MSESVTNKSSGPAPSPTVKIGVGVTIGIGLAGLAYYLWRRSANQSSAEEKSVAGADSKSAEASVAAAEPITPTQQMANSIARALKSVAVIRDLYRGSSATASGTGSGTGSSDTGTPTAATATLTGTAKNGRIRLRLLLDGLTQLQHTLFALQNFVISTYSTLQTGDDSYDPSIVAVSNALNGVNSAIDASVPDARKCQTASNPEWLLSGGTIRVRLYRHSESIYRSHTTLHAAIENWRQHLITATANAGADPIAVGAALKSLTPVRPEPPRQLQDLTREEEEVEDLYLLRGLTHAELQQTAKAAFAVTGAGSTGSSTTSTGTGSGGSSDGAERVLSHTARRLQLWIELETEMSVVHLIQQRLSILNTAVHVFHELDRTSTSGYGVAGSGVSDENEHGDDVIELLFRAEQDRLSLQTKITGLNSSIRMINLKLTSHDQTKSQLQSINAQSSTPGAASFNQRDLMAQFEAQSISQLQSDRHRIESERAKLLSKLESAKRLCILLKAYKNLPALFHSLNANVPQQLTTLHNGKVVQTLKTISQWSLCLQPAALPSPSDLFLMKHQIGEGMRALTESRSAVIARIRKIVSNYYFHTATATGTGTGTATTTATTTTTTACDTAQCRWDTTDSDILESVMQHCTLPEPSRLVSKHSVDGYSAGSVATHVISDESEAKYLPLLNQIRDQLGCTKSIHNTLKTLAASISAPSPSGDAPAGSVTTTGTLIL